MNARTREVVHLPDVPCAVLVHVSDKDTSGNPDLVFDVDVLEAQLTRLGLTIAVAATAGDVRRARQVGHRSAFGIVGR